jgi:hypothetical protein
MIKQGTPFPLKRSLQDGREDRYILARLFDQSDTQIGFHNVPHVTNGIYSLNTVIAGTIGIFSIKYEVYKDPAFTKIDKRYGQQLEIIRVEDIEDSLTDTIDMADGQAI